MGIKSTNGSFDRLVAKEVKTTGPATHTGAQTFSGTVAVSGTQTVTGTLNMNGLMLYNTAPWTTVNVGAKAGATVFATEYGNGIIQQTYLMFTNTPLTVRDTEQGNGVKVYDFPKGQLHVLGAIGEMAMTTTSVLADTLNAGSTCKWGMGTTTQANATLATTEQDIIPVTSITSSAVINVAGATSKAFLAAAALFDGTGTAKDLYLNISVPTATDIDADATVLLNGWVQITWIKVGAYTA
jgi:hypothetical protein